MSLIDQLPRDTKYRQALSLDEEIAETWLQSGEDIDESEDFRPSMADDSAIVVGLRDVSNQLRALRSDVVQVQGGKPGKMKYLQGPRTVFEGAALRKRKLDHYALTARLLPHKAAEMRAKIAELTE